MWYGYHILSKEVLMQTENDDDLYGGQRSSEVKCGKLCDMATIFGQKNHWCKLGMMMTFMEVKANRGQIQWIIFVLPLWYLVSRWGLGSKVCMHHFGCGNGIVILYYLLMRRDVWFENHLVSLNLQKYTISGGRKGADLLFLKECIFGNHKCTIFSPFSVEIYMYIRFWGLQGAAPPCLR